MAASWEIWISSIKWLTRDSSEAFKSIRKLQIVDRKEHVCLSTGTYETRFDFLPNRDRTFLENTYSDV